MAMLVYWRASCFKIFLFHCCPRPNFFTYKLWYFSQLDQWTTYKYYLVSCLNRSHPRLCTITISRLASIVSSSHKNDLLRHHKAWQNLAAASSWIHVGMGVEFPRRPNQTNPITLMIIHQPYEIRGCQHNKNNQRLNLNLGIGKTRKEITHSSWLVPVFRGKSWRRCPCRTGITQWFNLTFTCQNNSKLITVFKIVFSQTNCQGEKRETSFLEDKRCHDIQISLMVVEISFTPG